MADKAVTVELGYRPALLARIRVDYDTLRRAGVQMEDCDAVEAAAHKIAVGRIIERKDDFDPLADWVEAHFDETIIDVDNGIGDAEIPWDDLTPEEQARVPECDRP